ncbi:MAG: CsgG/HfaB family protein [Puniceicoccaceae bacterium]
MKRIIPAACCATLLLSLAHLSAETDEAPADPTPSEPVSTAVLDFEATDRRYPTLGKDAADLLTVSLMSEPGMILVERSRLAEALSEQELGLSGMVDPQTAAKVGNLTGAKVLVSGRVFDAGGERIIVARVLSAETGRVFAEKVSNRSDAKLSAAVDALGKKVAALVAAQRDSLVAPSTTEDQMVAKLRSVVEGRNLPTVSVRIPEEHIGRAVPDPAAETEIALVLRELGFTVVNSAAEADVAISGEAFSELGMTKGNLVSCRARLEVKALSNGEVVFVGRETTIAVDLAENFAGKKALQSAGLAITEELVPALVSAWQ